MAIDGEGFGSDSNHWYGLLAASNGTEPYFVTRENGLSTVECLEFLLEVKRRYPRHRMVGFGYGYDVNMMLKDLTEGQIRRLWEKNRSIVTLENGVTYRLEWIPGKTFAVQKWGQKGWAKVSDVFGFFQMSFVRSLEAWNVPDTGGHIARMKAERGSFQWRDQAKVLSYCVAECELLCVLMERLEAALNTAEVRPSQWIGAGSVAARMLRKFGVNEHRVPDMAFGEGMYEAIMHGYFGGRTEVFLQGELSNVVNYDINSAYPSEAIDLPSLVGARVGTWREGDRVSLDGIYYVKWNVPPSNFYMPFPFRYKGGIYYPENGEGWYHGVEVKAALELYSSYIEIQRGFILYPDSDSKPFSFIPLVYAARQEAKRNGHASEKAFKLGINALYGKLAQGYGFGGRVPPFQSFYWAGRITAGTRAKLLTLANENLSAVVSVATDGIIFSGDPGFAETSDLGGLEKTIYSELFIAQPGIYWAVKPNGDELVRTRGFFSKEIDWEGLRRGWETLGPRYEQSRPSKRFVGAGSALQRSDMEAWRKWVTSDRIIKLHSSRKYYDLRAKRGRVMRLFPPSMPEGASSEVYVPKGRGLDEPEFVAGLEQPLEVF